MHLYIYCVVKTGQIVPQNNFPQEDHPPAPPRAVEE